MVPEERTCRLNAHLNQLPFPVLPDRPASHDALLAAPPYARAWRSRPTRRRTAWEAGGGTADCSREEEKKASEKSRLAPLMASNFPSPGVLSTVFSLPSPPPPLATPGSDCIFEFGEMFRLYLIIIASARATGGTGNIFNVEIMRANGAGRAWAQTDDVMQSRWACHGGHEAVTAATP